MQDCLADSYSTGTDRGVRLDLDLERGPTETQNFPPRIANTWHLRFAGPDEATSVSRAYSRLGSAPFPKRLDALWNPL